MAKKDGKQPIRVAPDYPRKNLQELQEELALRGTFDTVDSQAVMALHFGALPYARLRELKQVIMN